MMLQHLRQKLRLFRCDQKKKKTGGIYHHHFHEIVVTKEELRRTEMSDVELCSGKASRRSFAKNNQRRIY